MTDTTINGLGTALAATAAADDLFVLWDTSASATKKHAAAYLARSDGSSGHKLITGSGRELTVSATGTAALVTSGSWTPGLAFGGNGVGMTFASRTGSYVQIGKIVLLSYYIALSAAGSSTGVATITGLPHAAGTGLPDAVGAMAWYQMATNFVYMALVLPTTATTGSLVGYSAAGASYAALTHAAFANNSIIEGTIVYQSA